MTNMIATLGIDLGKNWFHLTGLDKHNQPVYRTRLNRKKLAELAATLPPCVVAMESCPGSQYWGRRFAEAGHQLMIIPAQFVKPFLKTNKNDFNDSLAIAETAGRPDIRCVPLKNSEQLELQAVHRVRNRLITERTAIVNQMRALLLENGIVVPPGRNLFARELPSILEDAENGLTVRLRALIDRLRNRWRLLDTEIDEVTELLKDYPSSLIYANEPAQCPVSDRSYPLRWSQRWVMRRRSSEVAIWPPGWGWCQNSSPQETNQNLGASANVATASCVRC